ncbi:Formylglycine-generating enzyme, required for sulfatase activity, contains SUMF1/FGE domain [Muriicola jejuensis]|nr:formylglycine-generating enzyme family protein [Muriicola jejuensis]SMP04181.1 Formylglycine-generating enzyme, required for sulfatase activity, contains SUMF1/FGE domain [Muriicola jejuensis]
MLNMTDNGRYILRIGLCFCTLALLTSCGDGPKNAEMHREAPEGMRWVPGSVFMQGARAEDPYAMSWERPAHEVEVDGFYIDVTEVTNAQFRAFVTQTGYVTTAERPVDWEVMKKTLPPGTTKPPDSLLLPGSMVFTPPQNPVSDLRDISQWWRWQPGASWQHPQGPGSTIEGRDEYPVVHISYEDALAYCNWAGRRLPTEAEWELAARGENPEAIFTWGTDADLLPQKANTWQGRFPDRNDSKDGFVAAAPVGSFPANANGLYDMAGNVWEWTQDWFRPDHYAEVARQGRLLNPRGPDTSYNPVNPYQPEKVIKGGSYLCHASYCASFRISARMGMSPDSSTDHVGFRTVMSVDSFN